MKMNNYFQYTFLTTGLGLHGTIIDNTLGESKHYVLVKDVYKFMYNQTKHEHRKHFCMYCLQSFCSCDNMLKNHQENW